MVKKTKLRKSSCHYAFLILLNLLFTSCDQKSGTSSELIDKVQAVQEQMMKQGNVSAEEKRAILGLAALVSSETKSVSGQFLFEEVENAPVFPGCEGLSKAENRKCFEEGVADIFAAEFNFALPENLENLTSPKVDVFFSVDENGGISNFKVRKINIEIQAEAIRVLNLIPKMEPATQNGEKVAVVYQFSLVL